MNLRKELFLLCVVMLHHFAYGITRAQVKKTLSIMKKQCMPKHGVTEEKVGKIDEGVFYEERNVMCYMACIYKSIQGVKNDKLNYDALMKQIDILFPAEVKPAAKSAAAKCKYIISEYKDLCEASYWLTKCMYDAQPDTYIFA